MDYEKVTRFTNRSDAGRQLASRLRGHVGADPIVLGLPRGGVPVAAEVARALDAPLDVIVVRKLGLPSNPEVAMGAIGEGGVRTLNAAVIQAAGVTDQQLEVVERRERAELDRRSARFRDGQPAADVSGRTVIIVDDGVATGSTALAACQVARALGAARIILAVPVAPPDATFRFAGVVDEFIALVTPAAFRAVGQAYLDFSPTEDDEVVAHLVSAAGRGRRHARQHDPGQRNAARDDEVSISAGAVTLPGRLTIPQNPIGVVLFAHGSGSSRHSTRNRSVASVLHRSGIGTLLFDLLTVPEETDRSNVFDISLLAGRLADAALWLRHEPGIDQLPFGYFGASTGAAAALCAAARPDARVAAIVSRGGRPDLAGPCLSEVTAPTLLIVGSADHEVLHLNRQAMSQLRCPSDLVVVPGATHLFQEPGTLEWATRAAQRWFTRHFTGARVVDDPGHENTRRTTR